MLWRVHQIELCEGFNKLSFYTINIFFWGIHEIRLFNSFSLSFEGFISVFIAIYLTMKFISTILHEAIIFFSKQKIEVDVAKRIEYPLF